MRDPAAQSDSETGRIEVKNTTCYMCACRCGIRVTLRDGEIRYIEGNPEHPLNKGVICAKGASGIMKQYSPGRLTKPLLRKRKAVARRRQVRGNQLGAGLRAPRQTPAKNPRRRSKKVRPVHRA